VEKRRPDRSAVGNFELINFANGELVETSTIDYCTIAPSLSFTITFTFIACIINCHGVPTPRKSTSAPEEEFIKIKIDTAMCFYVLGNLSYPFDYICH